MNIADAFKYAPKYISQRFYGINNYVWKTWFPGDTLNERLKKLQSEKERTDELARLKDIANEASLVILIVLLRSFFEEGTRAAIQAVDTFQELGIEGFQIGSKVFSGRNEDVMRGELLADKLEQMITTPGLSDLIKNSRYPYQVLNRYKQFV
jgi:hypothetical protein